MKTFLKILFSVAVVAVAIFLAMRLVKTRPQATRAPRKAPVPVVDVLVAEKRERRIDVTGMGTVIPARRLIVQPEVSGPVIEYHPGLVAGGLIAEGEEILRIDPREYELAVEQQRANVERARVEMQLEEGRRRLAEVEFELFETEIPFTPAGKELALRRPQLRNAEVGLENAANGLERAELNVERTRIVSSFNALVLEESVEVGQLVTNQSRLATLVGIDEYWVQVSIPLDRVGWVSLPGEDGTGGSTARIVNDGGAGKILERRGRVVRLLGDLDPVGRMARIIIAVEDPLGKGVNSAIPLLLGSYVRVSIEGKKMEGVFSLPPSTVREGNRVWLLNDGNRLEIRTVEVLWRGNGEVLVRNSLHDGDRVISSRLRTPVPGMELRLKRGPGDDTAGEERPEEGSEGAEGRGGQ
jgi:RND family efflux transporter MFP subunit